MSVDLKPTSAKNSNRAETTSTNDSLQDCSDSSCGVVSTETVVPQVILASEAVLFFDNLDNYLAEFGKVLAVNDINE